MEKKTVVARIEVIKGKENEFLSIAATLVGNTRKEEGNISYTLYQNPENPAQFIFYEEYKDQAAMDFHAASKHFNSFAKNIEGLQAKDIIIESF